MQDGPTSAPAKQNDLAKQDAEFKKIALLGLVGVIFAATLTAGANAAFLLIALGAAGAAIYYHNDFQQWFNAHQTVWIGATAGFFFGGATFGLIGMALGGWLGHFAGQQINSAMKVVDTVTAPITYAKDTTHNAWSSLQSRVGKTYQLVAGKPEAAPLPAEPTQQPTPVPKQVHRNPILKPILKKPAPAAITDWQVWQTFTGLFTRQPQVKTPEAPITKKAAKKVTWQQDIANNKSKANEAKVPEQRAKEKSGICRF